MKIRAKVAGISRDWKTGKYNITLEMTEGNIDEINPLQEKDLSVDIKPFRKHRSKDANGLLWHCIGIIAQAFNADKWDIYLGALKDHGQFTYITALDEAVEDIKKQWREVEVIGDTVMDVLNTETGELEPRSAKQMLCYFGSSTYNTAEFSRLLNGVIEEMKELGLERPTSEEMKRALDEVEKNENKNARDLHGAG